jgi:lipopolysaccharide export system protein LptA
MNRLLHLIALIALIVPTAGHALESDREQPATITADEVDIDFATGKRIYTGNVKLRQGTIKLDADKLEVYFKDSMLEKAIAVGKPAMFQQRPDGKEHDVIGKAIFIHLDEIQNVITLTREASLTQGPDSVDAKTIIYDMANDKMKIKGNTTTTKNPVSAAPAPQPATTETAPAPAPEATSTADDGQRRAKITLKPKAAE